MPRPVGPVFVLGMTMRSGTNFVRDLLGLHPDLSDSGPVHENFLLEHAGLLEHYTRATARHWNPDWRVEEDLGGADGLLAGIGSGILGFLDRQSPPRTRLISKSPSVRGLPHFFRLFPRSQLVIIIRDGRAVTESYVRSFGRSYEMAMREWDAAARTITEFTRTEADRADQWRIVRYEELQTDAEPVLRDLFTWLGEDPDAYPFPDAATLPVRGSSEVRRTGDLHWRPVERGADFRPLERFAEWPAARHRRFAHVAGASQRALGYDLVETPGSGGVLSRVGQSARDVVAAPAWPVRNAARSARYLRPGGSAGS